MWAQVKRSRRPPVLFTVSANYRRGKTGMYCAPALRRIVARLLPDVQYHDDAGRDFLLNDP